MSLNKIVKQLISTFWLGRLRPRIIYYHSISPADKLSLHPDTLRAHIYWLKQRGYRFFTFFDIVQQSRAGKIQPKSVAITFDDGYLDNYEYALPILCELDVPATFFVVSGMIGPVPRKSDIGNKLYPNRLMMSRQQVAQLVWAGMEVGSHTHSHIDVRRTMLVSRPQALDELKRSRQELEDIIGHEVASFAYPNGQKGVFDASTRDLLVEAGYRCAATTIWGYISSACDPMEIPRMEMRADEPFRTFQSKMNGQYDFMRYVHLLRDGSRLWGKWSSAKDLDASTIRAGGGIRIF